MKSSLRVVSILVWASLLSSEAYSQSAVASGLSNPELAAQNAEEGGSFSLAVVSEKYKVAIAGAGEMELQPGTVFKIVESIFSNTPKLTPEAQMASQGNTAMAQWARRGAVKFSKYQADSVAYIVANGRTVAFGIPRAIATVVPRGSEGWSRAAEVYMQQVSELEAGLNATESSAPITSPEIQTQPSMLSRNDRIRMLYVLREEKYISSIRAGETLADSRIMELHSQALTQRRLRGIERAVRDKIR